MSENILYQFNLMKKDYKEGTGLSFVNRHIAEESNAFHKKFEKYYPTPLLQLSHLARLLGLQEIYVKNEAERFGLNAFKGLGGSFAVGKYLANRLGKPLTQLNLCDLTSSKTQEKLKDITLVTATDGNHGRGVAWAAEQFGLKAIVLMPKGSSPVRAQNIRNHGAECTITDYNYDDTVRLASQLAERNNWILLQDTAWEGYEEIPTWIMQGYLTLANEALTQLKKLPTHIILQAGVGSFAGAIMGFFIEKMKESAPKIIVVEPHQANCLYQSACANDSLPHKVDGDMQTIMAGLACGEPNTVSWPIIRDYTDIFISADDHLAANGMRIAASPRPDTDPAYISGESGAIGLGLLYELKSNPAYKELSQKLELDENSRVLLINTEGDTSPDIYQQIVWMGRNK